MSTVRYIQEVKKITILNNEEALYSRFKEYNSKENLIRKIKKHCLADNLLSARFILLDGTLIKAPAFRHIKIIDVIEEHIEGFSKEYWRSLRLPNRCRKILLKFFLWRTSSLRIYTNSELVAVQLWLFQDITKEQWDKINFLIKVINPKLFVWDIEYEAEGKRATLTKEEKCPTNNLSLKIAYNKLRQEKFSKSLIILS